MKTRADKILEGFKLGSLGVSKKPKVTINDPVIQGPKKRPKTGQVKILKQGDERDSQPGYNWILWEDKDGMRYSIFIGTIQPNGQGYLFFRAGENLEYDEKTSKYTGYDLQGISKETKSWQDWKGLFALYVMKIRKDGIKGLLNNFTQIFRPNSGYEERFQTWLRDQLLGLNK
jgi:hypothetical protein